MSFSVTVVLKCDYHLSSEYPLCNKYATYFQFLFLWKPFHVVMRPFYCYSTSFTVASIVDEYPTDLLTDSIIPLVLFYAHMLYISLKTHICPCIFQKILARSLHSVTSFFYEWVSCCRRHYFLQYILFCMSFICQVDV